MVVERQSLIGGIGQRRGLRYEQPVECVGEQYPISKLLGRLFVKTPTHPPVFLDAKNKNPGRYDVRKMNTSPRRIWAHAG